jgi:hypothetical protein
MSRKRAGPFPFVDVRFDFPLEQLAKRLAKQLMLVCLDHCRTLPPAISVPLRASTYTAHP